MTTSNESVSRLIRFVRAYRRRLIVVHIGGVGLALAAFFLALTGLLQLIFAAFPWTFMPLLFDVALVLTGAAFTGYCLFYAFLRAPDILATARQIEARGSAARPLLSLALELFFDPRSRTNPFTAVAAARADAERAGYPHKPATPRYLVPLAIGVPLLALWCAFTPPLSPKLLDYWALPFSRGSASDAIVSPGTVTVRSGAAVDLSLRRKDVRQPSSMLSLAYDDGRRTTMLLRPDSNGVFSFRLDSVTTSLRYRFSAGAYSLRPETLTVVPRPRLHGLAVTVVPPAYTKKPPTDLAPAQGSFDAYAGSHVRMTIVSRRLGSAWMVRVGRDTVALRVTGDTARGEVVVDAPFTYTFALEDTLGQKSDSLPYYRVGTIRDEPPLVQIVRPGFNKALTPEQVETLHVEGSDDIAIHRLALAWQLSGNRSGGAGKRQLPVQGTPSTVGVTFVWHLVELSLYPGDTVYYWAEITDVRSRNDGQKSVSDTFWFRIPSFEERFAERAKHRDDAQQALGAVRDRQGELGEALEKVMKTATRKNELSWEQREVLRDVRKALEANADTLAAAVRSLQKNIEQLRQEGAIGEEIAKKYEAVRKAVEELTAKYGDSLLFARDDLEKPLSWKEMRAAIEKVQSVLPRLEQELDNVLKFLEMLKQDRELAELAMRAERLAQEQAELARSDRATEAKMQRQNDLLEAIKQLSSDAANASATQRDTDGAEDAPNAMRQLDSLLQSMRNSLAGRTLPAGSTMRQMSGALSSLSQELMAMMNFSMAARMEQERQALLHLSRDAIALADWQEEINRDRSDPASRALAQQALKDALSQNMNDADNLSTVPPDMLAAIGRSYRNALSSVEGALGALGSGEGELAMSSSSAALRSLASSLLAAVSSLEGGQQSSCSGGACMLPGLRRLSGRQAAINALTAQLLSRMLSGQGNDEGEEMGGEAQSAGAIEQARRAAAQAQQAIADQLKELAEKYGQEAGESMRGRVGALEEEARRMAALLSRPDPQIIERQDRFLARMLETTLSMHRQGEGKDEWKSRTAQKTIDYSEPIEPGKGFRDIDTFHLLRQRALGGNVPEAYRGALRAYFEALSERYLKEKALR